MRFLGSQEARNEDAAELYCDAAAQWKRAKNFGRAAIAHVKQAELLEEANNQSSATSAYKDAAVMYKKADDIKSAVTYYRTLVGIYQDTNRIQQAAKTFKEIAALELEVENVEGAIKAWEEAAECYYIEDQIATQSSCRVEVAKLCGENKQLMKAAEIYESLAEVQTSGTNWNAPTYLWKATLCRMATEAEKTGDLKDSEGHFTTNQDLYPKFHDSREGKLLAQIFAAFNKQDVDGITTAIASYDRISRLDPWCTRMLLTVKQVLRDGAPSGDTGTGDAPSDDDEFA